MLPGEDSFIQKVFKATQGVMFDEEADRLLLIGPNGELVELTCDETGWLDVDWIELTEN